MCQEVSLVGVALPLLDLSQPGRVLVKLNLGEQCPEGQQRIADDRRIDGEVLTHFGGIQVNVDDFGLGGEGAEDARQAVIQARADGNQHVTLLQGIVGKCLAVHASHSD